MYCQLTASSAAIKTLQTLKTQKRRGRDRPRGSRNKPKHRQRQTLHLAIAVGSNSNYNGRIHINSRDSIYTLLCFCLK